MVPGRQMLPLYQGKLLGAQRYLADNRHLFQGTLTLQGVASSNLLFGG